MPVEQAVGFYRSALVEAVVLLIFFLLALGAITVAGRALWAGLGATESLLARIAAALVLGSMAAGGTSGIVFNLLQPTVFADASTGSDTVRSQTLLGIGLAVALTVVAVFRLERYNRARAGTPVREDEADWKVEPPATGRR